MTGYSLKAIADKFRAGIYQKSEVDSALALKTNNSDIVGAIGNINSPLLDMPLNNSLAMKSGVGSVTFTRASTATYIDRYGVLKTAAIDEPRFEKEGYLNEGASTNLNTYSEDTSLSYALVGATSAFNTNIAPDGNTTADKLLEDTSTGFHYISKTITVTAGVTHTASRFIMKTTTETDIKMDFWNSTDGTLAFVIFNPQTGVVSSSSGTYVLIDYGTYWRLSITATPTVANIANRLFLGGGLSYAGDGTTYIIHWGYQLEALPFATSYIPTTSATVTRSQDRLSISALNNVPANEFTIAVDYDSFGYYNTYQAVFSGSGISGFAWGNGTGNSRWYHGSTVLSYPEPTMVRNNRYVFSTNAVNGMKLYKDGINVASASYVASQPTITTLDIGYSQAYSRGLYGHISNFRIYDFTLTVQEVALA